MRLCVAIGLTAVLLLGSSALAAPEVPGQGAKITPDPDITPSQPIGAQARAKNGPDPLAVPPPDAGMSPDPGDMPVSGKPVTPATK